MAKLKRQKPSPDAWAMYGYLADPTHRITLTKRKLKEVLRQVEMGRMDAESAMRVLEEAGE